MKHFTVQQPFLSLPPSSPICAPNPSDDQPLQGLRLAVKDLFHIAGLPTTAGNPTWLATHDIPTQTASSVLALLNAGAEFVGKTITDELAYSLNGQNIHYGTPQNPITPERLPGGSSSGSAVAVAAHLADIGLGTDTGGSIRVPSSYNGLFGLRPTHGVIVTDELVGLAPDFDAIGVMTRSLDELEQCARVLLPDAITNTSLTQPNILIAHSLIDQVEHAKHLNEQLAIWVSEGKLNSPQPLEINAATWKTGATFRTLQGAQIWQEHGKWITLNAPDFAPDIDSRFRWTESITHDEINQAIAQQAEFRAWMDKTLAGSILILPTTPGRAPLLNTPDESLADYRNQLLELTAIAGLCGLPQLHLPVCQIDGAPCGVSLIGPRNSDLELIAFAQHLME